MKKEITTNDIMEVLLSLRDHVGEQLQELHTDMEQEFKAVRSEATQNLNTLRAQMVTKDYLDIKLADLKGELIAIIRGEDNKLTSLIEILFKKGTLSREETFHLLGQEPFARSI